MPTSITRNAAASAAHTQQRKQKRSQQPQASQVSQLPQLRPYQQLAVQHIAQAIARGERALYFTLPTGCGKGLLIGWLARLFATDPTGGRVLIIVHRKELVDQLYSHVQRALPPGVSSGIVMAAQDDCSARVIVATVQTLRPARLQKLLDASPEPITVTIVDEAHHVTDRNTYSRILEDILAHSPDVVWLGCTATPFRADGDRMQDLLPVCAFSRDIGEMQQEGWLAPLRWHAVRVAMDLRQVGTSIRDGERDYQQERLALEANSQEVVQEIVRQTVPLFGSRPVAVFGVDVAHAQALAAAYQQAGIRAAAVWGDMPKEERAAILAQWRSGQMQLVCNCQILTEGFDYPQISAIVLARPTQSLVNYLQMIGRGTRTAPGKSDCLIIDVAGNVDRTDPRQILLPDVVPLDREDATDGAAGFDQSDLDQEDSDSDSSNGSDRGQRGRFLFLRDPSHDSRWAWRQDPETGCYFLAISSLTTCLLAPDPDGSGLYRMGALVARPQPWQVERARQRGRSVWQGEPITSPGLRRFWVGADPLYELVQRAARWLKQSAPPWLGNKQQPWMRQPATDAQLDMLFKLDSQAAQDATLQHWTRGQVSTAITHARLRPQLPMLQAALWPESESSRQSQQPQQQHQEGDAI